MFDNLGDRMKGYEDDTRFYLQRKKPVIARLDGRAFHTFTKNFKRPYDHRFVSCMNETAIGLCSEIQGCQLAYVQSDEISLLLSDYSGPTSEPWFGYDLRKMCSVGASIATASFVKAMAKHAPELLVAGVIPTFDARFFSLDFNEVTNYFIWRQQDAMRNSVNSFAQAHFPHKFLQGKNIQQVKEHLVEADLDWSKLTAAQRLGVCVRKVFYLEPATFESRSKWNVDADIPVFTENRHYIEDKVITGFLSTK